MMCAALQDDRGLIARDKTGRARCRSTRRWAGRWALQGEVTKGGRGGASLGGYRSARGSPPRAACDSRRRRRDCRGLGFVAEDRALQLEGTPGRNALSQARGRPCCRRPPRSAVFDVVDPCQRPDACRRPVLFEAADARELHARCASVAAVAAGLAGCARERPRELRAPATLCGGIGRCGAKPKVVRGPRSLRPELAAALSAWEKTARTSRRCERRQPTE
jgi:hypothetical protein